ncbi:lipopolysaccharide biosynthesis protein [Brachybacterium sp. AOP29-B2-41]|uniref:lipopolysaccharide biosynthesis protein n=1 Tax=Brachybacterium sp. AOP29-B2-41 TaxID=3457704 RepID=UPI004033A3F1
MAASLASSAARGAAVMLSGQGMRILLQFLGVVTLARLLTPHDYGLLAIVVVLVGVGEIFRDFGLSSAAVRSPTLSRAQSSNLFWINTSIGVLLAALLFVAAAPLAAAFGQEEVRDIARAMAVVFLLNGATTQLRALLVRGLRFRWLAGTDVLAAALALGVALLGALAGWEYWALVAQQVTQALVVLVAVAIGVGRPPGLPRRGVPMRSFLRFGGNLVLSQMVTYATGNVDTAVVGLIHGASPLGLYNRAYQVVVTPLSQIQSPITQVAVPILSKIQDDQQRFSAYLVRGQFALGYPISIGLGIVVVAAEPITALMLGDRWDAAVPLLRFFALAGIARNLAFVGYWVYVVRGLSNSLFRYSLVTGAIRVACVVVGAHWGVVGVAAGFALAPWLAWPISLAWLSRITDIPTRLLYGGALRIIAVAGTAAGAAAVVQASLPPLPPLAAIAVTVGVVLFTLVVLCLVPALRADVRALWEMVALLRARRVTGDGKPAATSTPSMPSAGAARR